MMKLLVYKNCAILWPTLYVGLMDVSTWCPDPDANKHQDGHPSMPSSMTSASSSIL